MGKVTTTRVHTQGVTCVTSPPREGNEGNSSNAGARHARGVTLRALSRLCGHICTATGGGPRCSARLETRSGANLGRDSYRQLLSPGQPGTGHAQTPWVLWAFNEAHGKRPAHLSAPFATGSGRADQ